MDSSEYYNIFKNEDHHWWYKGLHDLVESHTSRIFKNNNKTPEILDAGCGTGKMLSILSKYGNSEGIDYSNIAIDLAKKRGLQNAKVGDLNLINYEKEKYDLIVSLDVLYHSSIKNDKNIVNSFYKSLKKDGVLILNLPAFKILMRGHDKKVSGERRYTKKELKFFFKKTDFKKVRFTYRLPHLFLAIIFLKFFNKFSIKKDINSDLQMPNYFINESLYRLNRIENYLILKGFSIPFGSSLFIVAEK
tara:strand:- start:69 stop:809 length:741 start_codon:yes stop_codon:yes gene_type:complete